MKTKIITILSTAILITQSLTLIAQENHAKSDKFPQKERYIQLGGGVGIIRMKDQSLSPIIHSGSSISTDLSWWFKGKKESLNIFYFSGARGRVVAEQGNERVRSVGSSFGISYIGNGGYMHLRKIPWENAHFQLHVGGDARLGFQVRNHALYTNSGSGGEGNFSLGPLARLNYSFDWVRKKKEKRRTYLVNYYLGLPLIGYSLTTAYAFPLNVDRSLEGNFSYIGKYTVLNSRIELVKKVLNNNRWGIAYSWNFYTHRYLNIVESADHALTFFVQFAY